MKRGTMPDSTVYEVEISTQKRGPNGHEAKARDEKLLGFLDTMLFISERKKKRGQ